jgi:dienelactone hydrolase
MNLLDGAFVLVTLATALWWALSRHRNRVALSVISLAALMLALVVLAVDGVQWQLVPWQVLAAAIAVAAALRRWRPGHSRRWRRVTGRGVLVVGLVLGSVALLTAFVPALPEPSGPHRVGSVVFRWTDTQRPETLTTVSSDHRQVVAQAWYPTDVRGGRSVPYFEAQGHLPGSIAGLPAFMFASFGSVSTHATESPAISNGQSSWPVVLFSPGLAMPREQYSALLADLASRGFVVVALSAPYESPVSVLAGGHIVGQTANPDVMGPPPHPAVERLIDIRTADSRFALDRLSHLQQLAPSSPLAGHLDLQHVGILGHSIGGATAVQTMGEDPRFKVGVNLDGKLFGAERAVRLNRPFLWMQSGGAQTAEYTHGRDAFLGGQREGKRVTVAGSAHMSFSDSPAYLTSLGQSLLGGVAGLGSVSLADMTAMTGDAISAFVGPALGVKGGASVAQALARHPSIRAAAGNGAAT